MSKKRFLVVICFMFYCISQHAQNTVGLLSYSPDQSFEGYNLIFPHNQSTVFLFDHCGQLINTWEDDANWRPGNAVYLTEEGSLIKCKRDLQSLLDPIWEPGGGDIVEIRSWDNELIWSFSQNDSLKRLHHDIEPMPNGNILMISWELKTAEEMIEAGRDPDRISMGEVYPEYILEVSPGLDSVVWEWHSFDHLIQDFDSLKANYGVIGEHPELIDINWTPNDGHPDWMHANAIDYNPELDQIILSIPTFNEIWIIDHSTSTSEAASHSGGLAGRGGDLLFRWGNPVVYRGGSSEDQKLFYQHDIKWINEFISDSHPDYGKLSLFNNRVNADYSTANILDPLFDTVSWSYPYMDSIYGSPDFEQTIYHPEDTTKLHSIVVSSTQVLPNENVLICAGRTGYLLELSPLGEIVWEYEVPIKAGSPVSQGDTLLDTQNLTFRVSRYPLDFAGFEDKDLSPKGYIEINPNEDFCDQILPVDDFEVAYDISFFPNPVSDVLNIENRDGSIEFIEVYNTVGLLIYRNYINATKFSINTSSWKEGLYFVRVNRHHTEQVVLIR